MTSFGNDLAVRQALLQLLGVFPERNQVQLWQILDHQQPQGFEFGQSPEACRGDQGPTEIQFPHREPPEILQTSVSHGHSLEVYGLDLNVPRRQLGFLLVPPITGCQLKLSPHAEHVLGDGPDIVEEILERIIDVNLEVSNRECGFNLFTPTLVILDSSTALKRFSTHIYRPLFAFGFWVVTDLVLPAIYERKWVFRGEKKKKY